jgi:hypothetical protein
MDKDRTGILHYFATIVEEDKTLHYFSLVGNENNLEGLAVMKAIELDGDYIIVKNEVKNTIHVVISCLTDNWAQKIPYPVITQSIKGLSDAQ